MRLSSDRPVHYPLSYGVNVGTWFVYDPIEGRGGAGAFYPNSNLRTGEVLDGLSKTVALAEVKAWNPYYRNAALDMPVVGLPADICTLGGDFKSETGHTEWVDGRSHQTGVTAAFPPNTNVLCEAGGTIYDVDWTNQQEGKSDSVATYAAVTARSYHAGGVNASRLDGSVHFVSDSVEPHLWQSSFTRAGGEAE